MKKMKALIKLIEKIYLKSADNKVYVDALTGCRTYAYYEDIMIHKYAHKQVCVIYVDCDVLKDHNDKYGHEYGNDLLRYIAEDLISLPGVMDVCRMGGDEFVAIVEYPFEKGILRTKCYPYISEKCSFGIFTKLPDETLSFAVNIADQKMLKNKKQRKDALKNK